ncbi:ATP-dependent RNA helicase P62 [Loa loa]|uniref:RNA helicase n=1 Tax=Loa loa TaxID=7209 RepID=A0A1I7VDZ1_LOALO|nr:ATP-dependent RNA helicase P62 [Loa loa]EFO28455.2 ATP-dependent RNA helicase P62 [Loa loa]
MSLFSSSDLTYGLLLRQIRRGDLCRAWAAHCSSVSRKPSKDQQRDVDVENVTQRRFTSRASNAKPSSWIDVNREVGHRPGTFRPRNVGLDRFFDTQRRNERSTVREQWNRRGVLSDRFRSSGGSWNRDVEMPKVDYKHLNLPPIQKNLYKESASVTNRSEKEIAEWFTQNEVTLKGKSSPRPIFEFTEAGFPPAVVEKLKKACFQKPTVIQSISWPVALTGHDMISIARTGSGKTLAYTLPGIVHMQNQQQLEKVRSPAVLILAPTRELVQQISSMAMNFHSKVACAYGGSGREQQARTIHEGVDILAAAPGRLLDFLIAGVLNLNRCTYLVLDEADRMLDMGFEPQIRKIVSMIRSDRQTLMFSATWPKEVRILAKDFLTDPIFVNVGSLKLAANSNIIQLVAVVEENEKEEKLLEFLGRTSSEQQCKTLVFVGMKRTADWLTRLIRKKGYPALSLHGDKSQAERNFVMNDFKNGECAILVATDVAARGLDVNDIKYVINFDCPKNIEDYIHRIGRTARHDKTGTSYTLCTLNDAPIVNDLVDILKEARQAVPSDLLELVSRRPAKSFRGRF